MPDASDNSPVTRVLAQVAAGDHRATDEFFGLVYGELRRLARSKMAGERVGQTLTPTALVNEAYLRLIGTEGAGWQTRRHFFGAAAEAMRRILVDRARRKHAEKRGGARRKTDLDQALVVSEPPSPDLLTLDEALSRLEQRDAQMSRVVKLRYFAGLTVEEVAAALDTSPRTVDRLWRGAKAWLYREMSDD